MLTVEIILQYVQAHYIELIGALLSLVWVYLEYRVSMWLWPVGIVLPIFYIVISINAQFYGNVLVNLYYLVTSIYGWWQWHRMRQGQGGESPITSLPRMVLVYSIWVYPLGVALVRYLLGQYTDSPYPLFDALATMLSFVGMVWLSHKWREHWLCWIGANAISSVLFYLSKDYISTVVFVVNLVVAVLGYISWGRSMRLEQEQEASAADTKA